LVGARGGGRRLGTFGIKRSVDFAKWRRKEGVEEKKGGREGQMVEFRSALISHPVKNRGASQKYAYQTPGIRKERYKEK